MKKAKIYHKEKFTRVLSEYENGYTFLYDTVYLSNKDSEAILLTLPLTDEPYSGTFEIFHILLIGRSTQRHPALFSTKKDAINGWWRFAA